jgi:hypothetical protein
MQVSKRRKWSIALIAKMTGKCPLVSVPRGLLIVTVIHLIRWIESC